MDSTSMAYCQLAFARRLGLNNQDSKLYPDPDYVCDTKNFEMVNIKNKDILEIYDMRYYRLNPDGYEFLLDAEKDTKLIGKTVYFRSPMTCASAARGEGVCARCYGNLMYTNANINIGQMAADLLSSIYTQTLLSAKHLLESSIIKMSWVDEFRLFFNVEFDQIVVKDDIDLRKYSLIFAQDDVTEDEYDEEAEEEAPEESNYLYSFLVKDNSTGETYTIRTQDSDMIYITNDFADQLNDKNINEDGNFEFPFTKIKDTNLFMINVQNDELQKVMMQVKNLIDNKSSIKMHDRNSILEAFIDANLAGRIKINAVHFEVLLMNQIRSAEDILEAPDWTKKDASYQIITLENGLMNNRSITVRLQGPKLKKTINSPDNKYLYHPSNMDLYTMVQPQEYIDPKYIDNSHLQEEDVKVIKPIYFGVKPEEEYDPNMDTDNDEDELPVKKSNDLEEEDSNDGEDQED